MAATASQLQFIQNVTNNPNASASAKAIASKYMASNNIIPEAIPKATSTASSSQVASANNNSIVPVASAAQAPQYSPSFDFEAKMNQLKEEQMKSAIAGLDKQKSSALSNLATEKAAIAPEYYDKRNQANATMNNNSRSFSDYLASRGLNSSGVSALGTSNNLNTYQGNLGLLGRQEQAANDLNTQRVTDINNNYLADVESARAGINAQGLQNLITQMNTDRTFNYNAQRDTVSDNQWNKTFDYNSNKDLGYVNPTANTTVPDSIRQQLAQYSGNYAQAAKDLATSNPTLAKYAQVLSNEKMFNDPNLLKKYGSQFQTMQNQQVQSGLQTDAAQRIGLNITNQLNQIKLDNAPQEAQLGIQLLELQVSQGRTADASATLKYLNDKKYLDQQTSLEIAKGIESIAASKANTAQGWAGIGISQQNANTNAAQLDWSKNPENPDNIYKMAQMNGTKMSEAEQKNLGISKLSQILDAMNPKQKEEYLQKQKYNIIKDFGQSTYDSLIGG